MPTKDSDKLNRRRLYSVLFAISGVFTVILLAFFLASSPKRSAEMCISTESSACLSCHSAPHIDGGEYHIRRVSADTGLIETATSDGSLRGDRDARDSNGSEYGVLTTAHAIWKRSSEESDAELFAGSIINGKGVKGFSGDGGPASRARLYRPSAVALNEKGEAFIADTANHRVRIVDSEGIIRTYAGNGKRGFDGDGGDALNAAIENPVSLAFDADGNLLVAHGNGREGRVRRIDSNGRIETAVGGAAALPKKGDGKKAVEAELKRIVEVSVDEATGDIYTAESIPIFRHINIGSCAVCHREP